MTIDFPKNVGHISGYEQLKSYVYDHLVHKTTSKEAWDNHLSEACRTWPKAANYLQEIAKSKTRWGSAWRLRHFTSGYEASSPVEGSFSSFKKYLGDEPKSFVGVVQSHVKMDAERTNEEKRTLVNLRMLAIDDELMESRSDPALQCAKIFSHKTTERFEIANQDSQNYESNIIARLTDDQISRGVTSAHEVRRRALKNSDNPPPRRLVEEIHGVLFCSCLTDINNGEPDRHIQCVLRGAFVEHQFRSHFKIATDIEVASRVAYMMNDSADVVSDMVADNPNVEENVMLPLNEPTDVVNVNTQSDVGNFVSNSTEVIDSRHVVMPSQSLSQVKRHAASKTAKMNGKEKFNSIIE